MDTVTKNNVASVEFSALMTLLGNKNADIELSDNMSAIMLYYANRYDYFVDLWAVMVNEVKMMKAVSTNKVAIQEAMSKRDYLEKKASAAKLKYYTAQELSRIGGNK